MAKISKTLPIDLNDITDEFGGGGSLLGAASRVPLAWQEGLDNFPNNLPYSISDFAGKYEGEGNNLSIIPAYDSSSGNLGFQLGTYGSTPYGNITFPDGNIVTQFTGQNATLYITKVAGPNDGSNTGWKSVRINGARFTRDDAIKYDDAPTTGLTSYLWISGFYTQALEAGTLVHPLFSTSH